MKHNNFVDFLIILFIEIGISCFPVDKIVHGKWLVYLIKILLQIGLLVFHIIYVKKCTKLVVKNQKIVFKNLLIFSPAILVCFSNYFYLIFAPEISFYNLDWTFVLEIILALFTVINEEFVFRQILLSNLEFESKFKRILVSSLVFAVSHIVVFISTFNPTALLMILYNFFLGLLLAFLYEETGSKYPPIVIHFLYNVFNGILFDKIIIYSFVFIHYTIVNAIIAILVGIYFIFIYKRRQQQA